MSQQSGRVRVHSLASGVVVATALSLAAARVVEAACINLRPTAVAAHREDHNQTVLAQFTCSNVGVPPADDWKWGTNGTLNCPSFTEWPAYYKMDCPVTKVGSCCGPILQAAKTLYVSHPPSGASQGAACSQPQGGTYGCDSNIVATAVMFDCGSRKNCDAEGVCSGAPLVTPTPAECAEDESL